MAAPRPAVTLLSRTVLARPHATPRCASHLLPPLATLLPSNPQMHRVRAASASTTKSKKSGPQAKQKKKKKGNSSFILPNLRQADQFSLCDAMRYIRAFEVGRPTSKYELAIRLRTLKNGPVIRNRLRLPHPVSTSLRVCVICPPDSEHAKAARAAGATLVGEDVVFDAVKAGRIEFDRCVCHVNSQQRLNQMGLGRILGPRGLMPSAKLGTVVKDVGNAVKDSVGGSEYRERVGVIRLRVAGLEFTPDEVARNVRAVVEGIKRDAAGMSDRFVKEIHEVVLSSTFSPGFSLNGDFKTEGSVTPSALST